MSNYGPKSFKSYVAEDNIKRKLNNTGDSFLDIGPNKNEKSYSTKPGQLSAKSQAEREHQKYQRLNKRQPIKKYSKEEYMALLCKTKEVA